MTAAMPATAQADPPLLYAADVTPGTNVITYEWALWEGARSEFVEVATSPEVNEFGYFRQAGLVNFEVVGPDQQELTDFFRYLPGTYYVHVAGHDPVCGLDCPSVEFSNIKCFEIRLDGQFPAPCLMDAERIPPDTALDAGPLVQGVADYMPTFEFSSSDPLTLYFECRVDQHAFAFCESPHTTASLPVGMHTFEVRAVNVGGVADETPARVAFAVTRSPPAPTRQPPTPTLQPSVQQMAAPKSSVTLTTRRLRLLANRRVSVRLTCKGPGPCAGSVVLRTLRAVSISGRKRVLRLGSAKFSIGDGKTAEIGLRLSRRHGRLVRRLGKLRVKLTVTLGGATVERTTTLSRKRTRRPKA